MSIQFQHRDRVSRKSVLETGRDAIQEALDRYDLTRLCDRVGILRSPRKLDYFAVMLKRNVPSNLYFCGERLCGSVHGFQVNCLGVAISSDAREEVRGNLGCRRYDLITPMGVEHGLRVVGR